jgi:hypothetical protein
LTLWGLAGCGTGTTNPCTGQLTVSLTPPVAGAVLTFTDLGPTGVRTDQGEKTPLPMPSVVLKLAAPSMNGPHLVRVVGSDKPPSQASASGPVNISVVARQQADLDNNCPTVAVALAAVRLADSCLDGCDAQLRCGTLAFADFASCQASCDQKDGQFADQQAAWVSAFTASYAKGPMAHKDPAGDAAAMVTTLMGQLDSCNFAACGDIDACGQVVLPTLSPAQ